MKKLLLLLPLILAGCSSSLIKLKVQNGIVMVRNTSGRTLYEIEIRVAAVDANLKTAVDDVSRDEWGANVDIVMSGIRLDRIMAAEATGTCSNGTFKARWEASIPHLTIWQDFPHGQPIFIDLP